MSLEVGSHIPLRFRLVDAVVRAHYLLLLPIWGFCAYGRDFAGCRPQGGEAIFLFAVVRAGCDGIGAINALLLMVKSDLV
jgi:hypothetical protein